MKKIYIPPLILSFREGFSSDHSHECYGCVICGEHGHGPFIQKCEDCGAKAEGSTGDDCMCWEYCEFKPIDDFCCLEGHEWCQAHSRIIKYKDNDGNVIEKGVCLDCFEKKYFATHRYCPNCQANLIAGAGGRCPFCNSDTDRDVPSPYYPRKKREGVRAEGKKFKINTLQHDSKQIYIEVKLLKKINEKEVTIRNTQEKKKVAEFLIGDDTGKYILSAWESEITDFEKRIGMVIYIKNGYVTAFKGKGRLSVGLYGSWEDSNKNIIVKNDLGDIPE